MIAHFLLPLLSSYFPYPAKILIPIVSFSFAVFVLPYQGIPVVAKAAVADRTLRAKVAIALVVRAISTDLLYLAFNLIKEVFYHFTISNVAGRGYCRLRMRYWRLVVFFFTR